ncbi:calcium-binding protein [uncultured Vibrio sp.]|uniref:calcium-binding protein n=1 Tax=uncultured Vibrio sp. TaxID=114054 RepID=UPI0026378214|nr:calcium-binding protein [uncultured Vibrio sp.]
MANEKVFLNGTSSYIKLDAQDNHVFGSNKASEHILGKAGDDQIIGGKGEDILEGNRGNDILKGGDGEDILFGGVGNDRLLGGEGADTFAMRITHGGVNTIQGFQTGQDTLQFILDRQHFLLENELARNEKQENRLESRLNEKVVRLDNKYLKEDLNLNHDATGLEKANAFVDTAVDKNLTMEVNGDNLVLTFFDDLGKGNKGTTIILKGLAQDENIARILNSDDDATTQQDSIIEMLTTGKLIGTHSTDTINGTELDEVIEAKGGNDQLNGGDGVDTAVFTGSVLDYHFQNRLTVTDTALNRDGKDQLDSIENLRFTEGEYQLKVGHNAYDKLTAQDGTDTLLIGAHGHDELYGGSGNDVLFGDNGVGFTYKGGNDYLNGGAGNDILHGGAGNDVIDGGAGEDTIVFNGSVLDYSFQTYGYIKVVDAKANRDGIDNISNFENLTFEEGTFTWMRGNNASNNMNAQDGVDTIMVGMHDHDTLTGGNDNDVLIGDNGSDFTYQSGDDYLDGGAGQDIMHGGADDDYIRADEYAPAHKPIYAESNIIDGGEGSDTLWYNDTYKNADSLNVSVVDSDTFNVDTMLAGEVTSTDVASNIETLIGTRGNDTIDFSGLDNGMTYLDKASGAGTDTVTGTAFDDIIKVMNGDDVITGGDGNDYIDCGNGIDTIVYAANTNILVTVHGAAYRNEYSVDAGQGNVDIVKNIEHIEIGDAIYDFALGEFTV